MKRDVTSCSHKSNQLKLRKEELMIDLQRDTYRKTYQKDPLMKPANHYSEKFQMLH